jgi:ATP/maltotriose-dependent transcriptional regulator MalT
MVLIGAGRLTSAATLLDQFTTDSQRWRAPLVMGWVAMARSENAFCQGEVVKAEAEGRLAWDACLGGPDVPAPDSRLRAFTAAALINALVARGEVDAAQDVETLVPSPLPERSHMYLAARAELRIAQGRTPEAITDLQEIGALIGDEFHKPIQNWRLRLAVALANTGVVDEAVELATAELEQARLWQVPLAVGRALVALGVVTSSVDTLEEAVEVLDGTEGRLDHAVALIELGALLRRSGSPAAAREPLRAGMDLAARCGATAYADRAHGELVAAGSRPRRDRRFLTGPEALTAGEFRVAELAATGLTNREIAQRLFVTQAAVQFHLRNTFRKLGIAARRELAEALNPPMTSPKT